MDHGLDDRGVAEGHWGTDGHWHAADPAALAAVRAAVGEPPLESPACWFVDQGSTESLLGHGEVHLDDGTELPVRDELPPDLPVGAHELHSAGGHLTHLFVVPPAASALPRGWGWAVQLGCLPHAGAWGVGDLAGLGELARRSAAEGAAVVAFSPLGCPVPVAPIQPSPYHPSSRRVGSPMYLSIPAVPGAERTVDALEAAAAAGETLNRAELVPVDEVWHLKMAALAAIWSAWEGRPPSAGSGTGGDSFARAVRQTAAFNAAAEGGGRAPADRVRFWEWVLCEVDRQLGVAAADGALLMADLPVGFDPGGADASGDVDLLAEGVHIGAPPDDFAPDGQDWGLPPYVPWRLRAAGYRPWIDTLRCVMRHAAVLRIDHVMGLMRQWWVQPGAPPSQGAYVHSHGTELLAVAVIEAHRAGVALVGEDLGTVDPAVRQAMAGWGVGGYRVALFEDDPPDRWPACSVAMLGTHDLPTAAGLWERSDGEEVIRDRLATLAAVPEGTPTAVAVAAAQAALGRAASDLVLFSLEDRAGERERPNRPGTLEVTNWRRRLPVALEDLDLRRPH